MRTVLVKPVHSCHTNKYDILLFVIRLGDSVIRLGDSEDNNQVTPSCASKRLSTTKTLESINKGL